MRAWETETGVTSGDRAARDVTLEVHRLFARRGGDLPVRLWDGTEVGPPTAPFRLVLTHPGSLRALLLPPTDLAAGEAYVHGDVDVEGSLVEALDAVAQLRARVAIGWRDRLVLLGLLRRLPRGRAHARGRARLAGRLHSRDRDRHAVRHHYDVGNDFYRLFLGERLVYSCAYFDDDDPPDPASDPTALDRAQVRKLELICRKLALRPGERFLDVGCGWGSLVLHAAAAHGVEAVGVTLSEPQAEVARRRVAAAGLDDRVTILVEDYRDVSGRFDAVASVGMFEHVGPSRFETYFARMHELTAPGGRFLNHAITTGGRDGVRDLASARDSFVGAYVFPDGALAPAHVAVRLLEQAGFHLLDVHQLQRHYAMTLRHWVDRLERNEDRAVELVGATTYRVWRAYLSGSVVGFETDDLGVVQVLGTRGPADVPLRRAPWERRMDEAVRTAR